MIKKIVAAAFFLAVISFAVCSALADDPIPVPGEDGSPGAAGSSYFQGDWSGSWAGFADSSANQEVKIHIGRKITENTYVVKYSWGAVTWRRGSMPAGRITTEGREQGDTFSFQWEGKQGRKMEVTLRRLKEDEVKARIEKSGPSGPGDRPVNETFLYRK